MSNFTQNPQVHTLLSLLQAEHVGMMNETEHLEAGQDLRGQTCTDRELPSLQGGSHHWEGQNFSSYSLYYWGLHNT